MAILNKLKEVLDQAKISYEIYNHRSAFTAQETAESLHDSGKQMAKVVIVKIAGCFAMLVVPADHRVSLRKVMAAMGVRDVALASEDEFAYLFPGCEIGAMPPFGNLFGMTVYIDPSLERRQDIFFNAGNHHQTVKLSYADFRKLVHPVVVPLTESGYRRAA